MLQIMAFIFFSVSTPEMDLEIQQPFSTKPQCCLTFSCTENVAWYAHSEKLLFGIFVPMSSPRSLLYYVCDLFFIFIFILISIHHIILLKQTHLFFPTFLECALLFVDDKIAEIGETLWPIDVHNMDEESE